LVENAECFVSFVKLVEIVFVITSNVFNGDVRCYLTQLHTVYCSWYRHYTYSEWQADSRCAPRIKQWPSNQLHVWF